MTASKVAGERLTPQHYLVHGPPGAGKMHWARQRLYEWFRVDMESRSTETAGALKQEEVSVGSVRMVFLANPYAALTDFSNLSPSSHQALMDALIRKFVALDVPEYQFTGEPFVVVVRNAHTLDDSCMRSLRVLMERKRRMLVFMFLTHHPNHIIAPLMSRFIEHRVSLPPLDTRVRWLHDQTGWRDSDARDALQLAHGHVAHAKLWGFGTPMPVTTLDEMVRELKMPPQDALYRKLCDTLASTPMRLQDLLTLRDVDPKLRAHNPFAAIALADHVFAKYPTKA